MNGLLHVAAQCWIVHKALKQNMHLTGTQSRTDITLAKLYFAILHDRTKSERPQLIVTLLLLYLLE